MNAFSPKPKRVFVIHGEDEVVLSVRNRVEKDLNLVDGQLPRISQKGAGHGFCLLYTSVAMPSTTNRVKRRGLPDVNSRESSMGSARHKKMFSM